MVPFLDSSALAEAMGNISQGNTMFAYINTLSGGAFSNATLFAMGITPYINSSIIIQLLCVAIPPLERLARDGEAGRKKIGTITRYVTVALGLIQGTAYYIYLRKTITDSVKHITVYNEGFDMWFTAVIIVLVFTAGTALMMWLGEQITDKGVGKGISLIIFCGIVVGIPRGIIQSIELIRTGDISIFLALCILVLMACVVVFIVFVERAQRRIPISYAKRQIGRKIFGGQNSHLPLRLNTAGVIPPIFASSLLLFPATIGQFSQNEYVKQITDFFAPMSVTYNICYVILIFFFCYFYTAIIFDPKDMAENLKKNGGFIPGIRPGENTQNYIDNVLSRLTLSGGIYIAGVSLLPMLLIAQFNVPFYFGGTSLLILVGVAMDFMNQVESHMINSQYAGLMEKARKTGRLH